ncbi:hypothetical protein EV193_104375 [Herbihabitans rhizosphaerae]|uniref:Dephospho-CoA kinase n=1 Tax=Herbihabitans rhizosphaerae TaxID=1872711 RepID=A0A4Q7KQQ5_9PSEU|nr:hypothetical protein [Herbihabitans rhizosphaerae]RZS39159.1 hypothetical protein EV193_104375 [Herbihabitans rhizosphaerae]
MHGVGIIGRARAGKDTLASVLIEERGFTRVGFADSMKALALKADPMIEGPLPDWGYPAEGLVDLVRQKGWERAKDDHAETRRFLQRLGTGARDVLGEDVWLRAWERKAHQFPRVVVPDVRFENEADLLRAKGYTLVRVVRPGLSTSDTHVSETEQESIRADVTISNDSTYAAYLRRAHNFMEALDRCCASPIGVAVLRKVTPAG